MKKLNMVDLVSQYQEIKTEVSEAIDRVLTSAAFINGEDVQTFAHELALYTGAAHVIPCANGTDALQIAMMALDLQPGDEVITASFTYVATAEVIALLKLTPVLVDVDPKTFNIDIDAVKKAITPKTKAIVPVHLFGQCADMKPLMALAKEHGLYVIEDTAQAIGSEYTFSNGTVKQAGTMGDIGCTSFFPSKNLGCYGDGGAIFTNDDNLALKIRQIANHGQSVRYYHDIVGVNSRLDTLQAAILRIKLKHLRRYTSSRQKAAAFYDNALGKHELLEIPFRSANSTHVFHQYTLMSTGFDRFGLQTYLQERGIPCMVYYPVPLHLQKAYQSDRYKQGDFPVTERLCAGVFSLPMHTELDEEQLTYITEHVLNYINNNRI
jgi:dTDP-4-amino-4,6-dideoxygalactose transaminase